MTRYILTLLVLFAAAADAAAAVSLNKRSVVRGDMVRVGDLFAGAGPAADLVVGRAPIPGKRKLIDARRLRQVARDAGLDWTPANRLVTAVVVRDSRIVDMTEIEVALRRALKAEGVNGDHEMALFNRRLKIHVAAERAEPFRISGLRYDPGDGRFAATLEVLREDGAAARVPIAGRIYTIVEVPVLNRRMRPGEVIRAADIDLVRTRSARLARNAILDRQAMVGMTPRRYVRAGIPVRHGDLRQPVIVAKGSTVTLFLRTPAMMLTAKGRAGQDGARGETIRVVNTRSNKSVEGVVVGHGRVVVSRLGSGALALGGTR